MILDLEKLSDERITGDEVLLFRDAAGEENRIHCHVELDIRRQGEMFYIHAELTGELATSCHKCLEPTTYRVSPSFELVVRRVDPRSRIEPVSVDDDFVMLPAGQNRLEFDRYLYENLVVDMPMTIACSDDCKGLCASCGANLNREECRCDANRDPCWNKLSKLRDTLSE